MISLGISDGTTRAAAQVEMRSSSYTDLVVSGLLSRASGAMSTPLGLGALETCAGLWGRAFSLATVSPASAVTSALTASWRAQAARSLCRSGECVFAIYVAADGRVELLPCSGWTVRGGSPREDDWLYQIDLQGPDGTSTRVVPSAGIIHLRYATDAGSPWVGKSPLQYAADTGVLGAGLERSLSDEVSGPVGSVIPVPRQDGEGEDTDPLAALQQDIAGLRGRPALIETVAAAWGEGRGAAPQADWKPSRIGGNPPAASIDLREAVTKAIMAAHGVPAALFEAGGAAGGREALRLFYRSTVLPVARLIEGELRAKLDTDVRFGFRDLAAADVATSVRAFSTLTKGGMSPDEARKLAGLE